MPTLRKTLTIADEATASPAFREDGYCLIGILVPTIDSSTLTFSWSATEDGTFTAVYTNTHGAAPAALNLGTAMTTTSLRAVPEEVSRLSEAGWMKIVLAAQNGGPYDFTLIFAKR